MTASSSALGAGDVALVMSPDGRAAVTVIDGDLGVDRGMGTALWISLFTDRRAGAEDVLPSEDDDRRGWWADQFSAVPGDKVGSRLWLLARAPHSAETARRAEEYAREATAWFVEDRVASSVEVTAELLPQGLLLLVTPIRPGLDPITYRFIRIWE